MYFIHFRIIFTPYDTILHYTTLYVDVSSTANLGPDSMSNIGPASMFMTLSQLTMSRVNIMTRCQINLRMIDHFPKYF